MKGFIVGVFVTLLVIVVGAFAVSRLGLYPIGADNPPGAIERMLAMRAMDVYADSHKPEGGNPVATTPANLADGARLYEDHCALCHGGAAAKVSPMRDKFSPPVPQLVDKVPHDPDAWLFWVTKHGVRMTGMPAWDGILSDGDIWKTVAFIKHSADVPGQSR
jgi:mono/diheme cytochrome c family protein